MKGYLLTLMAVFLFFGLSAQVLSCYDIQYTQDQSGNSPYNGQTVEVRGIVTHVIPNTAFYISDPEGGTWSGVYVYHRDTANAVSIGDDIQMTCGVSEYFNLTELVNVSTFQILSQGNLLPPALPLTTQQMAYNDPNGEQYEGVLVRLTNVQIKSSVDSYGQFKVADTTNIQAMIDNGLFNIEGAYQITMNDWWYMIQGIVDYHSAAGYKVNPRSSTDMVRQDNLANSSLRIMNTNGEINTEVPISLTTSHISSQWGVASYTAQIRIDPDKVQFNGLDFTGTISIFMPQYTVSAAGDLIDIEYQSQEPVTSNTDDQVLIKLLMEPISYGETTIELVSFAYDQTQILSLISGKLLTPIQQDLAWLNITNPTSASNTINVELNEELTIEYGTKNSSSGINVKAIIRVYDAQGRLVNTLVNKNITSALGIESYNWDGRDSAMRKVPIGLYYCHLEMIERSTGAKQHTVQPIIIKSILK